MVNSRGLLEDDDLIMSQYQDDSQSQASVSTIALDGRRPKNCLRKDLHLGETSSDDDNECEHGGSDHSSRQGERVEQGSPLKALGHFGASQKDYT